MDDTIVAIATPPGRGGIGIVRLSGPRAVEIATKLFAPARTAAAWQREPRRMMLGSIIKPDSGEVVDQALLCLMPAPRSYTRQDVVEIHAHGGPLPLRQILQLCLQGGARLANPGEFTLRAFVNGRIDLAQAEAVLDTIQAETEAALHVAQRQLEGHLSMKVKALRQELLQILAYLQARADFPDEDVPERNIIPDLERAGAQLGELLSQAGQGMLYRQGVRTAIVGRPNVGKSRLLNCLVGADRAIVTNIPGTTRDTLNETIDLDGIPFEVIDTAGITHSANPIEVLGIERSRKAVAQADLVLLVIDASQPSSYADLDVAALLDGKKALVVLNKSDLNPLYSYDGVLPGVPHLAVSALTGAGLRDLRQEMVSRVLAGNVSTGQEALVSNPRHRQALEGAQVCLQHVREAAGQGIYQDLWSIDLTEALRLLGEITGETASDELLTMIFSAFCIGK
ncbi:MAG: tRNA uridine-5-carboxymethylaminomethyl(34) synthesis GTPase MnmE [Chloroflexi bacterium]|nr:tRNA uridine-5-carboxymethylaminomethyl(34) synthesis GTPase MnmE [Chloroflexota bacterium]